MESILLNLPILLLGFLLSFLIYIHFKRKEKIRKYLALEAERKKLQMKAEREERMRKIREQNLILMMHMINSLNNKTPEVVDCEFIEDPK